MPPHCLISDDDDASHNSNLQREDEGHRNPIGRAAAACVSSAEDGDFSEKDYIVVEEPPRVTNKTRLPEGCQINRNVFNDVSKRSSSMSDTSSFEQLRCSSSITQYVAQSSRFHNMTQLNERTKDGFRSTELCCWHDGHPFAGQVYAIPKSFDTRTKCFVVYGCFCSLACCKAFMQDNSTNETPSQLVLLERMAREVYNIDSPVNSAPPRVSLSIYGGPYSLERFRSIAASECTSTVLHVPYVCSYMIISETDMAANNSSSGKSIGNNALHSIGTVKGIRRPAKPIDLRSTDYENFDPQESPYYKFLRAKGVDTSSSLASAACCASNNNNTAGTSSANNHAPTDPPKGTASSSSRPAAEAEQQGIITPSETTSASAANKSTTRKKTASTGTLRRFMAN